MCGVVFDKTPYTFNAIIMVGTVIHSRTRECHDYNYELNVVNSAVDCYCHVIAIILAIGICRKLSVYPDFLELMACRNQSVSVFNFFIISLNL